MKFKGLIALAMLTSLISCGQSEDSTYYGPLDKRIYTINDLATINVGAYSYSRVVCLGAGALRYYSYVGDLNKLIAVEGIDSATTFGVGQAVRPYYDANKTVFGALPTAGLGGPVMNGQLITDAQLETLVNLEPDIIISFLSAESNQKIVDTLELPVVALSQGQDGVFDEVTMSSLYLLGKIFHKTSEVEHIANYVKDFKADLDTLTVSSISYYAGCIGNWGKTNLYGSYKNFPVFDYAKVTNVVDSFSDLVSHKQVSIDKEKLVDANPSKIFIDSAGLGTFLADYKANKSSYEGISAIENGEVYTLLPYNAYYTNLEIQLTSTLYVASIAHPNDPLFENMDLEAKYDEVFEVFNKKAMYQEYKVRADAYGAYNKINLDDLIA